MRKILITILSIFIIGSLYAQRTPQPTANPSYDHTDYTYYTGSIRTDQPLMISPRADTNISPLTTAIMFVTEAGTSSLWYWNLIKWSKVSSSAGDVTLQQLIDSLAKYVKYDDSTLVFTTPTQLKDSLGNYVNLFGTQTVGVNAYKDWLATQTFDGDSSVFNGTIYNKMLGTDINNHVKTDSLDNMYNATSSSNRFFTQINNPTYSYHNNKPLPFVGIVSQQIRLDDTNDSLSSLGANQGAFGSRIGFRNVNGSAASTYFITNDKTGSLTAASIGAQLLSDSSLIVDGTKTWNIDVPIAGVQTFAALPIHGTLYSYADLDAGMTTLLDSTGNDYAITNRYALYLRSLSSSNTNKYAIMQVGTNDSVVFNSSKIVAPNLPNTATSYQLYYDPTTGLITYDALPTAFNNSNNFINASYQQNNLRQVIDEMIASKKIIVKKKKHKTIIEIKR